MEQEAQTGGKTKGCPKCGEEIQVTAKKCKHCQADLRSGFAKHKILTGFLVLIAIVIFISIIGSYYKTQDTMDSVKETAEENEKQLDKYQAIVDNSLKEKDETDSNEEVKTKQWVSVVKLSATENKQSEAFSLNGGKQKLVYATIGANVNCYVYMLKDNETLDEDGGFPEVMIDKATSDETLIRKSKGSYYLDIKPVLGDCLVEIMEER